jgi:hypothetical protein
MNTNQSSSLMVRNGAESSFFQKMFVAALIIALLFASLPARAALAAPAAGDEKNFNTNEMQKEWDNKLEKVENNSIFYQRVRVYPANFEDLNELAIAHDLLNNYGAALRSAQRIVINHPGFDQNGKVTNENQANQSLKDLSENLRLMRVYKAGLDQLDGEYILLPMSAITSTPAQ